MTSLCQPAALAVCGIALTYRTYLALCTAAVLAWLQCCCGFSSLPCLQNSAMHSTYPQSQAVPDLASEGGCKSAPTIQRGTQRDIDPNKMPSGTFQYATVGWSEGQVLTEAGDCIQYTVPKILGDMSCQEMAFMQGTHQRRKRERDSEGRWGIPKPHRRPWRLISRDPDLNPDH